MNLSILLPLCGSPERDRACLASLIRTLPPGWRGEILLIADGDHPAPGAMPTAACRWFPQAEPLGPAALRAAAASVSAPVLCLLDPGTVFLPGWLPPMLQVLQRADHAGCIGNIQREPYSGLIDHAGIGFDADGLPVPVGGGLALLPRGSFDRRAAVSMACCLVRRSVFEELGGFDAPFQGRPLGGVDFCLRAAVAGYRHYVANRSVVYRYDDDDRPLADDPDLPLYLARWGHRARRCHERRVRLRSERLYAPFSAERWEMAREARRLHRLETGEIRAVGRRYLAKHWHRPWRYNAARVTRALGQAFLPLPAPVPLPPGFPADAARPDDGWLFDPPPRP